MRYVMSRTSLHQLAALVKLQVEVGCGTAKPPRICHNPLGTFYVSHLVDTVAAADTPSLTMLVVA